MIYEPQCTLYANLFENKVEKFSLEMLLTHWDLNKTESHTKTIYLLDMLSPPKLIY